MLFASILLQLVVLLSGVQAAGRYCTGSGNDQFCVFGAPDASGSNVVLTVHSAATGWVALGLGTSMSGSTMWVGWTNSTNGVTFSTRESTGYRTPAVSPSTSTTLVPLAVPAPAWARIAFSFSRDLSTAGFNQHDVHGSIGRIDFVTAPGCSALERHNHSSSNGQHQHRRQRLACSTPDPVLPAGTTYNSIVITHAIIMIVAWILCPFAGIFVARFLKKRLGVWWFRLHVFFMLGGATFLGTAGIVYLYLYKSGSHFESAHQKIGLVVACLAYAQVILGIVIDHYFESGKSFLKPLEKLHEWHGRILGLLAIVTVILGLVLYNDKGYETSPTGLYALFGTALGVGIGSIVLGIVFLPKLPHDAHDKGEEETASAGKK
ncbi:hypothetical protein BC831DRAFT_151828 [Entophlyctis helioformis]|nr:hypothetical protein BC831DRAFT_151828 [Entophlyctis helioformis]